MYRATVWVCGSRCGASHGFPKNRGMHTAPILLALPGFLKVFLPRIIAVSTEAEGPYPKGVSVSFLHGTIQSSRKQTQTETGRTETSVLPNVTHVPPPPCVSL